MNNQIDKIIFATSNQGKMDEIKMIMKDCDIPILSLKEAGIQADIVEDGTTFEENAVIKARAIMELTGCLTLADDSGLEVDYINKEPGVYSARYLGEDTPYSVKNQSIIDRLQDAKGKERSARFVCAIAACFPNGKVLTTYGTIEGEIGYEERGEYGFGYDPILFVPEYGRTTGEMLPEFKNEISHRGIALRKMWEKLQTELNN
ncbi:MAG: RdgB/HAM1 family non-canonical purine NTP pyrophosphatase [Lachnospiraceae bacterium]|nr:RdgB/HAM1 family non-canonical purine NTP pyrophosphatase [Lachnospiraceae bacterium]